METETVKEGENQQENGSSKSTKIDSYQEKSNPSDESENKINSNATYDDQLYFSSAKDNIFLSLVILVSLLADKYVEDENLLLIVLFVSSVFNLRRYYILLTKTDPRVFIIKISIVYFAIYMLLVKINPFYNLLFIWFPYNLETILKSILIVIVQNLVIKQHYSAQSENIKEEIYHKCPIINFPVFKILNDKIFTSKKKLLGFFLISIFLNISFFFYDTQFFVHFVNKDIYYKNKRFFICANIFNNEDILEDWTRQMHYLIDFIGKENVYISIHENGDSWDNTRSMLLKFKDELDSMGIPNTIITWKTVWYRKSQSRLKFLEKLRHAALNPFYYEHHKKKFHEIIYFNDIIFNYKDIIRLDLTNNNKFTGVCGLDFDGLFYDIFATFLIDGSKMYHYFPYNYNYNAQKVYYKKKPIRVFACWNGVAIFKAKPFENNHVYFKTGVGFICECSMLMHDMWRIGEDFFYINPVLRFSYAYYPYYVSRYIFSWAVDPITFFFHYWNYWKLQVSKGGKWYDNFDNYVSKGVDIIDKTFFGIWNQIKYVN